MLVTWSYLCIHSLVVIFLDSNTWTVPAWSSSASVMILMRWLRQCRLAEPIPLQARPQPKSSNSEARPGLGHLIEGDFNLAGGLMVEAHSTAMQCQHHHEAGSTGLHGTSSMEFPDLTWSLGSCRDCQIGGRTITNLRFADDIDGLAGTETELANLVERLDKTSAAYGMQISAEKTKLMTNNINGISSTIKISGEKIETVQSFKYLRAIVTDEGSRPEILSRIAQATGALANLKVI